MAAHLMAVVSSVGPEHGGKVQGVGAAGGASSSCPRQRLRQPRISINAREHPGRSRHEAQKTPSQTPDHLSRPACHVPAGTRSPGHNQKTPDYLPPKSRARSGKSNLVGHRQGLRASMPSLISSLIRLRPETFGLQHLRLAAQAADPLDLAPDSAAQTAKACWGQPLASSNLASSAALNCQNYRMKSPILTSRSRVPSGATAGVSRSASVGFTCKGQSRRPICRRDLYVNPTIERAPTPKRI